MVDHGRAAHHQRRLLVSTGLAATADMSAIELLMTMAEEITGSRSILELR